MTSGCEKCWRNGLRVVAAGGGDDRVCREPFNPFVDNGVGARGGSKFLNSLCSIYYF